MEESKRFAIIEMTRVGNGPAAIRKTLGYPKSTMCTAAGKPGMDLNESPIYLEVTKFNLPGSWPA